MPHKCDNCFYRTDWEGGAGQAQYSICEREWGRSFEECKAECEKPGECEFKLDMKLAEEIADRLNEIPN